MEKTKAIVIADAGPIIHLDELHSLNRSKLEVLELLRAIPTQTTLYIRASLLAEVISDVEKNAI